MKRTIIENCIKELEPVTNSDKKSFIVLLDYFCYKLGVKGAVFSSNLTIKDILEKHIPDVNVFKDDSYKDLFGEVYECIFNTKLVDYNSANTNSLKIRMGIKNGAVGNVYIHGCETGRVIMSFKRIHPKSVFYCVETDALQYKIALVNMKLYDIPCKLILVDPKKTLYKISAPANFKSSDTNVWVNTKE